MDQILASRLRERITIEQPVRTADTYGGGDVSWTSVATVYANVRPLLGTAREVNRAAQPTEITGYRIEIRKRSDVNAGMRILWKSRRLAIHSIHETQETLDILTYEELV